MKYLTLIILCFWLSGQALAAPSAEQITKSHDALIQKRNEVASLLATDKEKEDQQWQREQLAKIKKQIAANEAQQQSLIEPEEQGEGDTPQKNPHEQWDIFKNF